MVKFVDVDPAEIPRNRDSRRGRVSYPILKSFLETQKICVMLDRTGVQQSLQSLRSVLTSYIRNHNMPIKIFSRDGQIYLMRLDIDDDGNFVEDWQNQVASEGAPGTMKDAPATPITTKEVRKRSVEERRKTTK